LASARKIAVLIHGQAVAREIGFALRPGVGIRHALVSEHPSQPQFWDTRYTSGETPWDFGGVPSAVHAFLKRNPKGGRVLIPGCGAGYEIKAFADAGWKVTAIDLSPVAVERARLNAGSEFAKRVFLGDFFQERMPVASFDVIYERTFLCALQPQHRRAYALHCAELLKPGGRLAGFFYYKKTALKEGPPWGLAWGEAEALFLDYFDLDRDDEVADSIALFKGRERWQERTRNKRPVVG
jgi:SAM-dependent methyltransferase